MVSPDHYATLLHCIEKDCKVLESFGIMDYSLLLGVHNIDQAIREEVNTETLQSRVFESLLSCF